MPEILPDHVPSPRTALFWDGTAYRPGTIDAAGHVQIDVLSTVMDPLAATAAAQALALAQLQLIEDMRDALQSVATDRLIVRGEDQLFSFRSVVAATKSGNPSGANGFYDSFAVPAGEIWVVTTISARDRTAALTHITIANFHNAVEVNLKGELRAIAQWEWVSWYGHTYLDEDDVIRCTFSGCGAGDTVDVDITGYRMTPEV